MNILPFVLALLLVLSVVTVEKLEKFKSLMAVQHEYQFYLDKLDRKALNEHQKNMGKWSKATSQRQLSFSFFYEKSLRDGEKTRQVRQITVDLIKVLYGDAAFFKELESRRPNFIDEMLDDFIASAEKLIEAENIRRIEEIRRIRLSDPELQHAFYLMLKGTTTLEQLQEMQQNTDSDEKKPLSGRNREKGYLSLLDFLKHEKNNPVIKIRHAPRELLLAIFGKEEIVEAILARRKELDPKKTPDASMQFASEFKGKQKPGISDELLDFNITTKK